jgi:hypothetical protein
MNFMNFTPPAPASATAEKRFPGLRLGHISHLSTALSPAPACRLSAILNFLNFSRLAGGAGADSGLR